MMHLIKFFCYALIFVVTFSCAVKKPNECQINCSLKPEKGICKAIIPKYYFNNNTGKCEEFSWGGCNGVVPFDSLEECEKCKCKK